MRPDLQVIAGMVPAGSRVLDLGCGDGDLLAELIRARGCRGQGVEVDPEAFHACVARGVPVVHADIDAGLPEFGDDATCTITEGVAFLNGPEFSPSDPNTALSIMVHEFGHFSNLAHSQTNGGILLGIAVGTPETSGPAPNNTFGAPTVADFVNTGLLETMYPFFFGPQFGSETPGRDDTTSMSRLYPEANYFATTAAVSGSIFTPALVTFTRNQAALSQTLLQQFQYLHGATFTIQDRDALMAGAWIDHPETDPFVGPCPNDGTREALGNTLIYNGQELPHGRTF